MRAENDASNRGVKVRLLVHIEDDNLKEKLFLWAYDCFNMGNNVLNFRSIFSTREISF
jgi:hypothetical protein